MKEGRGVLVTGASHTIGVHVVRALLDDPEVGWVLAVGERAPGAGLPTPGDRLVYARADLRRERSLRTLLHRREHRERGLHQVIHVSLWPDPWARGIKVHRFNVEATENLLQLCSKHPTIRSFVFKSGAEVYAARAELPVVVTEDHPINFSPRMAQWLRDRVEADLLCCAKMGVGKLKIAVLRCSETLVANTGSQLLEYLRSRVCLRPAGYDAMINVAALDDVVDAILVAARKEANGIYNIPGTETLPLSQVIALAGRRDVPCLPPLVGPMYALQHKFSGGQFRYSLQRQRFLFGGIPSGAKAEEELGWTPQHPVDWSRAARPNIAY